MGAKPPRPQPRKSMLEMGDEKDDRKDHETADEDDLMNGIEARDILDDEVLNGEDEDARADEGNPLPAAARLVDGDGRHLSPIQNDNRPTSLAGRSGDSGAQYRRYFGASTMTICRPS